MQRLLTQLARIVLVVSLAAVAVALPRATSGATAFQMGSSSLDTPLQSVNMCGGDEPGDVHFTFAATGDTFPHENIQAVGESQGYDVLFDHVRPFLQAADIGYTNFDGAMLAGSPYTGYPTFNYNPQLASALHHAGIGVVSTANNHILDRGPQGIDATLEVLQQAGILQHGVVSTSTSGEPRPAYLPITLTRDGSSITIGFLSFTWGTNGIPDPYNQVNLLWESNQYGSQGNIRQSVLDAIAQARQETDLVIVAAHWGYEYQPYPDQSQIEGAAQMAAAGADVILGAQPHTLQPVDIIETDGRKTLVLYSLGNFIASQGAFQAAHFSNTSVIFYVGIIRQADGQVRVSGYRYLPTMIIDYDTRPAPIPQQGDEYLITHVRQKLRDPSGLFQVRPDPAAVGEHLDVCPRYHPGAALDYSDYAIGGDFAQHIATLGSGTTPQPMQRVLAVYGYPLGPPVQEPAGDCQGTTSVLYTERQRLEWHPENPWPDRVIGSQVGTAVYQHRYGVEQVQRRTDLAGDAISNEAFRAFYREHGGLPVFGYPISGELAEVDAATGIQKTVQYFERARLELAQSDAADSRSGQVQVGLLGREYPGIAAQCGTAPAPTPAAVQGGTWPPPTAEPLADPLAAEPPAAAAQPIDNRSGVTGWNWLLIAGGVLSVFLLLTMISLTYREILRTRAQARRRIEEEEQFLRDLLNRRRL